MQKHDELIKKTSKEWLAILRQTKDITIMDPDGWDRKNYEYSFNEELITVDEFNARLLNSTSIRNMFIEDGMTGKAYEKWYKMNKYSGWLTRKSIKDGIFVFGSNTEGRHGKGNALTAKQEFGAIYGQARGRQGNSYAIVTKDLRKYVHPSVPIESIVSEIRTMYDYAIENEELRFFVAYSTEGNLLSGFTHDVLAKMFADAGPIPKNIYFEREFCKLVAEQL